MQITFPKSFRFTEEDYKLIEQLRTALGVSVIGAIRYALRRGVEASEQIKDIKYVTED